MTEAQATPNIFDATAERFMSDVVERSRRQAVAVDFWAPWCGPCRALAPLLEQLVTHYAGGLAVARVNTDAEPAIASQFGIRSIPDVRIFRDGRMVDGFVGVQPLARLQFTRDAATASEIETLRAASERADAPLRDLYRLAAHELLQGDAARGLELLLTLTRRDRRFENGLARRALLQAFALLGDDDERVGQTRRRMATLLY